MGQVRLAPDTKGLFFADGLVNIGEPSAPTVIKQLNALVDSDAVCIMDAAPGTGCPVVEAVEGADVAVLVTEPTPFGLHDLKLAVGLSLKLGVPTGIVVNRSDAEEDLISEYANEVGLPILGRIPFRREYAEAYSKGKIIAEVFPEMQGNMKRIFERIQALKGTKPPAVPVEEKRVVSKEFRLACEKGSSKNVQEIAVISGKGGTGKTTVTAALLQLAEQKVMADNDVDAADLHLLLHPKIYESELFFGGSKFTIDPDACTGCGACMTACHFDAIDPDGAVFKIDEMGCEGCSLCSIVCPVDAISSYENQTGELYCSSTEGGPMVHARLGIAEENSGKLVSQVRQRAMELAEELQYPLIIADGPPGTSCPVIASITDVSRVLIVTEPTVSGVHDLERVLHLCHHFGVPVSVIINKADLNQDQAKRIHEMAEKAGATVAGEIPFDRNIHDALMVGKTIIDYNKGPSVEAIQKIWKSLNVLINK